MTNLDSILKSRDITSPTKVCLVKVMVFPWSCMDVRVGLWRKLSAKELMFLNCGVEKILGSLSGCKEIKPFNPKGNQSWIFIGRTDAEAETPILWSPDMKNWLIWKDSDAGKQKGTTEDEMVGWLTDSMDVSLSKFQELVMDREAWHAAVHGVTKRQTWLSDWTELNWTEPLWWQKAKRN